MLGHQGGWLCVGRGGASRARSACARHQCSAMLLCPPRQTPPTSNPAWGKFSSVSTAPETKKYCVVCVSKRGTAAGGGGSEYE